MLTISLLLLLLTFTQLSESLIVNIRERGRFSDIRFINIVQALKSTKEIYYVTGVINNCLLI